LVGDEPSLADCCLVPQLYSARRFGVALDGLPTLLRVEAACAALPAFERAHPDVQPDAPARAPA
jgi:maleylacetoacetate isomerase